MNELLILVLLPLVAGIICYLLPIKLGRFFSVVVQSIVFVLAIFLFSQVYPEHTISLTVGGFTPVAGIVLRADLLSSIMLLLTGFLFLVYLVHCFKQPYVDTAFLTLFFILESLILAIFLSGDLFNIYVLMEVGTIVVTLLILFKHKKRSIYDGMIYMMINIVAMMFFLLGAGMLYRLAGALDLVLLGERITQIQDKQQLILPCALMLTAVALKAAIFPVFSWLPKAHGTPGAPGIVSAVLSSIYVKAGIYLLIRVQVLFSSAFHLSSFFLAIGFITAFAGIILALSQTDIKRILAYSTVSQVGLILVGLGQGTEQAYYGALYHIVSHALFKSVLFLAASMIIDVYQTRNIHKIKGVFRQMPVVSIAIVIAMLGVTGAPFFNGSVSKYLIKVSLGEGVFSYGLILINLGTLLYFFRFALILKGSKSAASVHIPVHRQITVNILAFLCLIGGLAGPVLVNLLFPLALHFSFGSYAEKMIAYLLTLGASVLIYKLGAKRIYRLTSKLTYEPSFNHMCLAIVIYFVIQVLYLRISL